MISHTVLSATAVTKIRGPLTCPCEKSSRISKNFLCRTWTVHIISRAAWSKTIRTRRRLFKKLTGKHGWSLKIFAEPTHKTSYLPLFGREFTPGFRRARNVQRWFCRFSRARPPLRPKVWRYRSENALPEAADQERKWPLYEAFIRLPIEFREVLVLDELEGWNYTQLASALGIPRPMVVHRLSLARQSLRQELREAHRRE